MFTWRPEKWMWVGRGAGGGGVGGEEKGQWWEGEEIPSGKVWRKPGDIFCPTSKPYRRLCPAYNFVGWWIIHRCRTNERFPPLINAAFFYSRQTLGDETWTAKYFSRRGSFLPGNTISREGEEGGGGGERYFSTEENPNVIIVQSCRHFWRFWNWRAFHLRPVSKRPVVCETLPTLEGVVDTHTHTHTDVEACKTGQKQQQECNNTVTSPPYSDWCKNIRLVCNYPRHPVIHTHTHILPLLFLPPPLATAPRPVLHMSGCITHPV